MRTTTILTGASLTLLLAGCGGGVRLASVPAECTPSDSITVQYTPGRRIEVNSECISVPAGRPVTVTFSPVPALNHVRTKYTGFGNRWLDRKNSNPASPGTIVLPVPADDEEGAREFKYDIRIRDVGRLDPRIVVQ